MKNILFLAREGGQLENVVKEIKEELKMAGEIVRSTGVYSNPSLPSKQSAQTIMEKLSPLKTHYEINEGLGRGRPYDGIIKFAYNLNLSELPAVIVCTEKEIAGFMDWVGLHSQMRDEFVTLNAFMKFYG